MCLFRICWELKMHLILPFNPGKSSKSRNFSNLGWPQWSIILNIGKLLIFSNKDFEKQTKVGWVMSSASAWARFFMTYILGDYQACFHPTALYKKSALQLVPAPGCQEKGGQGVVKGDHLACTAVMGDGPSRMRLPQERSLKMSKKS